MLRQPNWTRRRALAAGRAFVVREHRLPRGADFCASLHLPNEHAVRRLFGTFAAYRACLPTPSLAYLLPRRLCLRCDRLFQPAGTGIRLCTPCKKTDAWRDGQALAWINGVDGVSTRWAHE